MNILYVVTLNKFLLFINYISINFNIKIDDNIWLVFILWFISLQVDIIVKIQLIPKNINIENEYFLICVLDISGYILLSMVQFFYYIHFIPELCVTYIIIAIFFYILEFILFLTTRRKKDYTDIEI